MGRGRIIIMQVYLIYDELHRIIRYYDDIRPMLIDLFKLMKQGKYVYYKREVFNVKEL